MNRVRRGPYGRPRIEQQEISARDWFRSFHEIAAFCERPQEENQWRAASAQSGFVTASIGTKRKSPPARTSCNHRHRARRIWRKAGCSDAPRHAWRQRLIADFMPPQIRLLGAIIGRLAIS